MSRANPVEALTFRLLLHNCSFILGVFHGQCLFLSYLKLFITLLTQRLMEDLDSYDTTIIQVNVTARHLLEKGSIEKDTFEKVHKETGALRERQKRLKNMCRENGDR